MPRKTDSVPSRILRALQLSAMTGRELAEELNVDIHHVRSAVAKLKQDKELYVLRYQRDSDGGRLFPRAVYALGDKKDAKSIGSLTPTEYNRRHREAKRGAVNSVFALGTNVEKRRLGRKSL